MFSTINYWKINFGHLYYNRIMVFRLRRSCNEPPDHSTLYRHPLYTSRKALTFRDGCNVFKMLVHRRQRGQLPFNTGQYIMLCSYVQRDYNAPWTHDTLTRCHLNVAPPSPALANIYSTQGCALCVFLMNVVPVILFTI